MQLYNRVDLVSIIMLNVCVMVVDGMDNVLEREKDLLKVSSQRGDIDVRTHFRAHICKAFYIFLKQSFIRTLEFP